MKSIQTFTTLYITVYCLALKNAVDISHNYCLQVS